jgi:hypothetical protein
MNDSLVELAQLWCAARELSEARLGIIVTNDSRLIGRLRAGGSCSLATFEKFLSFFRSGENWPDGCIPDEAGDILNNFENIATDAAASTGKACNISNGAQVADGGAA